MAVRDLVFIGAIIFMLALAGIILTVTMDSVVDRIEANPVINQSEQALEAFQSTEDTVQRLDYIIFAIFLGMILSLIIISWFVGGIPIFMFIYFLFVVLSVVFATIFANVWESVTQSSTFITALASFPITNHILLNLPAYMAVVGTIGLIVMFAKPLVER